MRHCNELIKFNVTNSKATNPSIFCHFNVVFIPLGDICAISIVYPVLSLLIPNQSYDPYPPKFATRFSFVLHLLIVFIKYYALTYTYHSECAFGTPYSILKGTPTPGTLRSYPHSSE